MFRKQPVPRVEITKMTAHNVDPQSLGGRLMWEPDPIGGTTHTERDQFTKDQTGNISDASYEVIEAVLSYTLSPTNPAVLLRAAREWYLAHGGHGPVLACIIEQICEVEGLIVSNFDLDNFKRARREFLEGTHVKQPA